MLKFIRKDNIEMKNKVIILFLLTFVWGWNVLTTDAAGENLDISLSPQYPGPYDEVAISLSSYTYNLNNSNISWRLNGVEKLSGRGKTVFSFRVGDIGSKNNLSIYIATLEGDVLTREITIIPATVDLLWTAETYTPFYYKGRALPTINSKIKFTAIPHFSNNNNLVYKWSSGSQEFPSVSGLEKSSFTYLTGNFSGQNAVTVKVESLDGKSVALATANIPNINSEVILYEEDPLYGVLYNRSLGNNFELKKDRIVIRAEPFYFSSKDLEGIIYKWFMNDNPIKSSTPELPNVLSLVTGGNSGSTDIGINVLNSQNVFQSAGKEMTISY